MLCPSLGDKESNLIQLILVVKSQFEDWNEYGTLITVFMNGFIIRYAVLESHIPPRLVSLSPLGGISVLIFPSFSYPGPRIEKRG
jgi:hypothetical protein